MMLKQSHSARAAMSKQIFENYNKDNTIQDECNQESDIIVKKFDNNSPLKIWVTISIYYKTFL